MDEPQSVQEIAGPGRLASPVNGAHPRDSKTTGLFCHIRPFAERLFVFTVLGTDDARKGKVEGIDGYARDLLLAKGDADYEATGLELGKITIVAAAAIAQAHAIGVESHKGDYDRVEFVRGDSGVAPIFSITDRRKGAHRMCDKRGGTVEIILVRDNAHLHALTILKIWKHGREGDTRSRIVKGGDEFAQIDFTSHGGVGGNDGLAAHARREGLLGCICKIGTNRMRFAGAKGRGQSIALRDDPGANLSF